MNSVEVALLPREFFLKIPKGWENFFEQALIQNELKKLSVFLNQEYSQEKKIFPPPRHILRVFELIPYDKVRVVILGQDPYHGINQATGLAFAVPKDLQPKPPSLKNIFKELQSDLGLLPDSSQSELLGWAAQGVFLLNTVLTVRVGEAFSHRDQGWEFLTDQVIRHLNARKEPIVFVLWGQAAIQKKPLITNPIHRIIESAHPSPLSAYRGFFGSKPFSKINGYLKNWNKTPINWAEP
jgi:uracil-DNA glycosylase